MSYKRDVAKFAQERSIKLATSRIGLDTRREWIRSTHEITARAPTKKSLMEADQNQWLWRSRKKFSSVFRHVDRTCFTSPDKWFAQK